MIVNERETPKGLLVSVCDAEIIGQTFENGEISLTVNEEFYGGTNVEHDVVVESLSRASIANIVGVKAVQLAIEHGFVDEGHVLDIGETRHAQLLRIS